MMMMMMMLMLMMVMCKRLAQVPMLCVPIYNMKLAMMQKTFIFITFSAHTKMAADKRGQIEVFARIVTYSCNVMKMNQLYPFPQRFHDLRSSRRERRRRRPGMPQKPRWARRPRLQWRWYGDFVGGRSSIGELMRKRLGLWSGNETYWFHWLQMGKWAYNQKGYGNMTKLPNQRWLTKWEHDQISVVYVTKIHGDIVYLPWNRDIFLDFSWDWASNSICFTLR